MKWILRHDFLKCLAIVSLPQVKVGIIIIHSNVLCNYNACVHGHMLKKLDLDLSLEIQFSQVGNDDICFRLTASTLK